jgi:hypothetical protein
MTFEALEQVSAVAIQTKKYLGPFEPEQVNIDYCG